MNDLVPSSFSPIIQMLTFRLESPANVPLKEEYQWEQALTTPAALFCVRWRCREDIWLEDLQRFLNWQLELRAGETILVSGPSHRLYTWRLEDPIPVKPGPFTVFFRGLSFNPKSDIEVEIVVDLIGVDA